MSDIVLLPGTTSGQDGYEHFAVALHRRGWDVHCMDLPTDRPQWVAADYATFVADRVGGDVTAPVVLGHSGAGLLIDPVAGVLRGSHAVWLAAYIPAQGISLSDENLSAMLTREWLGVDPTSDDVAAAYFLYHDCDYATLRWALTTTRLWYPAAAYDEPGTPRDSSAPPATVIVANQDRTLRSDWCRQAAHDRLGVTPIEVDAGHCPHVSRPDVLADLLTAAVHDGK